MARNQIKINGKVASENVFRKSLEYEIPKHQQYEFYLKYEENCTYEEYIKVYASIYDVVWKLSEDKKLVLKKYSLIIEDENYRMRFGRG